MRSDESGSETFALFFLDIVDIQMILRRITGPAGHLIAKTTTIRRPTDTANNAFPFPSRIRLAPGIDELFFSRIAVDQINFPRSRDKQIFSIR